MKIGIEAQRLFRKKKHGMDMVALELIRNLQQIDRVNEYYIFVKPDEDDKVIEETANFHIIRLKARSYPAWEQMALPKAVRRYGCDILHCTSNTAPVNCPVPLVTTLHDIIYMESSFMKIATGSASAYQKLGNIYRKLVVPAVVRNSSRVITVSNYERKRIADFFSINDDRKLSAVYNGVSTHFKPVKDHTELKRIREKYRLPEKYFFFLGNTDPKKNTKGTLKAFSDFRKQTGYDYKLVMLDYNKDELKHLLDEIGDKELINSIVLTGYVANKDLPAIYSQSELFLYPSLRESFGIPILEAMASGTPVITSRTSSMPEIAGKAGVMVDPYQPDQITMAMKIVAGETNLKAEMIREGIAQAAKFSWKTMATEVHQIYMETGKTVLSKNQTN